MMNWLLMALGIRRRPEQFKETAYAFQYFMGWKK